MRYICCCTLQELDPTGKFSSLADVWSFNAADKSSGTAVPFSSCCTPQVNLAPHCLTLDGWLQHYHCMVCAA